MENKFFVIGVRIEYLRKDIDKMQYGEVVLNLFLEVVIYNMVFNNKKEIRGIFLFCMCLGGEIVNVLFELGVFFVNGMSYFIRSGKFLNFVIVVGIFEKDYGN